MPETAFFSPSGRRVRATSSLQLLSNGRERVMIAVAGASSSQRKHRVIAGWQADRNKRALRPGLVPPVDDGGVQPVVVELGY